MTLYGSNHKIELDKLKPKVTQNITDIETINSKIPDAASSTNKLVDRASLEDALQGSNATFRGNFDTKAALDAYTGDKAKNDYAVVLADENNNKETWRYKYDGSAWVAEYRVNETALTVDQSNALNSGITSNLVDKINNIVPTTASEENKLATAEDITNLDTKTTETLDTKMDKTNPSGSGSLSVSRNSTSTIGTNSIALGLLTEASGDYSVSIGKNSIASSNSSVAIGNTNTVSGENAGAFAGTTNVVSSKSATTVGGEGLKASSSYQTVFGKYNIEDASNTYSNIVGNGTSDIERSNVAALDWKGNLYLGGTVYIDSDSSSQNGTSLSDYIATNTSLKLTGILYAGETSLVLTSDKINADMMVDIYASMYGIQPINALVEEGKVTLTFDAAFDTDITFGVRLENFSGVERADIPTSIKVSNVNTLLHMENTDEFTENSSQVLYYSGSFVDSDLIVNKNYCFNGITFQKLTTNTDTVFFTDSDVIIDDKKLNVSDGTVEDVNKASSTSKKPSELSANNSDTKISFIWGN